MHIEQIYTGCLAQGAYYITSGNEAAIIDPLREIEPYLARAKKDNCIIKYIFETHFHADFVSGHIDLAKATGGTIVYGPTAQPGFKAYVAKDDEVFKVGKASIKLLHTPGHTLESCCYLLQDEAGKDVALFSGDTLFLGDVGRPDLAQKATNMTQEELAGLLFDSLRNKIMPLSDDIVVYPAHGSGSACGKNMSKDTQDTLGHQKQTNYALRPSMTRQEFITEVLTGLIAPPQYFPHNVMMNKTGYKSIDEIIAQGLKPLSAHEFKKAATEANALILDTRKETDFVNGFIPCAVNIGLNGSFAPWVGALITNIKQPVLFVADNGKEKEVVTRLARVGYDNPIGYLDGGMEEWQLTGNRINTITCVTADELADKMKDNPAIQLLDVRKRSEYDSEHVIGAQNVPLDNIHAEMGKLDKDATYYIHCAAGYRSVIFISILMANGFTNLVNVIAGFNALKKSARFNISLYRAPLTML